MKSVIKTLYFSPKSDADLIEMYHQVGPKLFAKAIKESLRMVVRPGYHSLFFENLNLDPTQQNGTGEPITINISFNAEGDGDVRALLQKVKTRKMTHFMKMALRYAVGPYFTLGFFVNGNDAITKNYRKKELFFIEGASERVITKAVAIEKTAAEVVTKTEPVVSFASPIVEPPVFDVYDVVDNQNDDSFDDDDILAMLDQM